MLSFQEIIFKLQNFWSNKECCILQPFDLEIGAGTSHPATFLRSLGPEPWKTAYVQPSRRPTDGRYGKNPNRLQHYYQFQVTLKPSPIDIQNLYIKSLKSLGISPLVHDIRFVEDNWENPTLGAWGLGWEVWLDGMEISQFTYFQQVGGIDCFPITVEITYGIERLAMYLQEKDNTFDLIWNKYKNNKYLTYGDIYLQNEIEQSTYNFEISDIEGLLYQFNYYENEVNRIIKKKLILPAYELLLKSAHIFNLLDARNAISVTERSTYIKRIRNLSKLIAQKYIESRKALGFPLIKNL